MLCDGYKGHSSDGRLQTMNSASTATNTTIRLGIAIASPMARFTLHKMKKT
jgi:hypothetical protein